MHISAVLARLINACTPLTTMIVALFVLRQGSFRPLIIAGLGIGLVGVAHCCVEMTVGNVDILCVDTHLSAPSYACPQWTARKRWEPMPD